MAKPKVEGTPTVGLILKKWGLYRGDSLVPFHQLPVPGGKLWMGTKETLLVYPNIIFELAVPLQPWRDPLFETQSATHWFLQHLLVRPIVFYCTSNSIKTRLIKGGPEPLEKESHEFLGSKRDDWFSNPFFEMVPRTCQFVFRTCFGMIISVRARGHYESSRRRARR